MLDYIKKMADDEAKCKEGAWRGRGGAGSLAGGGAG